MNTHHNIHACEDVAASKVDSIDVIRSCAKIIAVFHGIMPNDESDCKREKWLQELASQPKSEIQRVKLRFLDEAGNVVNQRHREESIVGWEVELPDGKTFEIACSALESELRKHGAMSIHLKLTPITTRSK